MCERVKVGVSGPGSRHTKIPVGEEWAPDWFSNDDGDASEPGQGPDQMH